MNLLLRGLLAAVSTAFAGPAAGSPASDLLDALRARLDEAYYAPPGIDVAAIIDEASRKLAAACEDQGEACSTDTGIEVARAAIAKLGDRHTVIVRAPSPAQRAGGGGPQAPDLPFGWFTRTVRGQDHVFVAWVDPEGPAGRVGVRRHDRIIAPAGTTPALLNAGEEVMRVTVEREGRRFEVDLIPDPGRGGPRPQLTMAGDVAVIQFPSGSGEGVAQSGRDLLARAQAVGARAVVIDLRDNGGGGLECAGMTGGITDYTVLMRDRHGDATVMSVGADGVEMGPAAELETVLTLERPARWSGPVAVLVNENTASCSEAMAIQIERSGRGFVVGETTYGVGNNTVRPAPLTDGWAIRMTTAYSEDEAGRRLPPRPPLTIEVEDDPVAIGRTGHDAVLAAALDRLNAGFEPRKGAA